LAYARFKLVGLDEAKSYNFMLKDKKDLQNIDQSFKRISRKAWTDTVPGFFTKAGYENVFLRRHEEFAKDLTREAWVLGANDRLANTQGVAKEFEDLYQADYIAAWKGFLTDIEPLPVDSTSKAQAVLQQLTSNADNLLFRLIEVVREETDFSVDAEKKQGMFGLSMSTPTKPLLKVDMEFKPMHEWTDETRFESIGQLIDDVYRSLGQKQVFEQANNNALIDSLGALDVEARKLPVLGGIVQKMVQAIRGQVSGVIQQKLREQLGGALQDTLGNFCQQQMQGLYPLVAKSKQGMTQADFTEFFSKGGLVDQFRSQQLQSGKADPATLQQVKAQLAVADTVRKAFFPRGGLGFNYSLKLVSLSPELQSLEMNTGTQTQTFKLGESKLFTWPDGTSVQVLGMPALVETPPPAEDTTAEAAGVAGTPPAEAPEVQTLASENGDDWLIFRLFESKKWNIADKAVFQLVPLSPPDPFQVAKTELRRFKCPTL
ncbi:MAG: ImcF-related family protein, partial [Thiothrix litoralis]